MGTRIGEAASNFGLSPEMLRYLEKQGLLTSFRGEGGYREYDLVGYFQLYDYMRYRNMGLSVKEIIHMKQNGDTAFLSQFLSDYQRQLEQELTEKQLLAEFLKEYQREILEFKHNMGRYWFQIRPHLFCLPVGNSHHGQERYIHSEEAVSWRARAPFVSLGFLSSPDQFEREDWQTRWVFSLEERYRSAFQLPLTPQIVELREALCLCTYICYTDPDDAMTGCRAAAAYAQSQGYQIIGDALVTQFFTQPETTHIRSYCRLTLPISPSL